MSFGQITSQLLSGFQENLLLFFITLAASLPLGLLICMGSMTRFKPLKYLAKAFIWVIRGTPLMLQLFVVMYVPGWLFQIPMRSRITAAFIAFIINYAAYFSEIYRGGIESISRGQYEAGQVLGMTRTQVFFRVVLLQVIKRIIPPIGNETITLVKDTSLARVIGISEILMASTEFSAKGLVWPLFYTGVFFLLFNGILTLLLSYVEKKLNYFKS